MNSETKNKVRIEPSKRWVRAKFGGEIIADSKNTLLVWDNHYIPVYFFPREDVHMNFLEDTGRSRGERTAYNVGGGDQVVENAAWSYTQPSEAHQALKDYVVLRWHRMDHWYEEEEEVFVHARDPYTRVDTMSSSRHIRVEVDGVTVADSQRPFLLFETHLPTRYYLPQDDVRMDLLVPTDSSTMCPYKGTAAYWSVQIEDKVYKDIVWGYPDPIPELPKVKGLVSFYNEKVDIYVDGQLENKPQTSWS